MKSDRYNKDTKGVKTHKLIFSRFFAELYYFFKFHLRIVFILICLVLNIALILILTEWLFPSSVHFFNYAMTEKTFKELVESHHIHAAIALMESKETKIDSIKFHNFRPMLAECYAISGDYPKALEQYKILRQEVNREYGKSGPDKNTILAVNKFFDLICLSEELNIYIKMGDTSHIRRHYAELKEKYGSTDLNSLVRAFSDEEYKDLKEKTEDINLQDYLQLPLIQAEYIIDKNQGIKAMKEYVEEVMGSLKYNPRYELSLLNQLVRMLLEQEIVIEARQYLEVSMKIFDKFEHRKEIYPALGELSEYCYKLNDIENGRKLLKKYLQYIDEVYSKEDIDYALAHAIEFKYLLADGKINELSETIDRICKTLRAQVNNNFTGMTATQREYFIEQLRPVFLYANSLMETYPSEKLAKVVFDNNMFIRGLLLRSETSLGSAIATMNDSILTKKYEDYVLKSRELVARRYIKGLGNQYQMNRLEKELEKLEIEIAEKSRDFRRKNDSAITESEKLCTYLSSDEIVLQIIKGEESYYVLGLEKSGKISYMPIGKIKDVENLYEDKELSYTDAASNTPYLLPLLSFLENKKVYYSTDGIFNRVALSALPMDEDGKIVGDIAEWYLVGSASDLPFIKERGANIALTDKSVVLWGGIEYGDSVVANVVSERGTERGDFLGYLSGSHEEVRDLEKLLCTYNNKLTVFTGPLATESSFMERDKKRDYILHISTHAFFHDSGTSLNPMQNSGLLFAGSQPYWITDSIVSTIEEEDGILRADEITTVDLNGCRLVVLSACQTGLGKDNSEGVFGLQRAFKLAGVENILMSLWSVDDNTTKDLMVMFYSELVKGIEPNKALENARNKMRQAGHSPYKWAAFVLLN